MAHEYIGDWAMVRTIPATQKFLLTAWSWWVVGTSGGAVEWRMGTSRPLRIG